MKHFVFLLFTIFAIGIGFVLMNLQSVNQTDNKKTEFQITAGQSLDVIGANLQDHKLIRSRFIFKATVYAFNLTKKIQAGYFYLSPSMSTSEIALSLTKAVTKQVWLTIPEGLRREEIANLIVDTLKSKKIKSAFDPDQFIVLTKNLEGRLYPDTYALPDNLTAQAMIDILHNRFLDITKSLNISENDLSRVVILASLLEREAGSDSERPEIAGIITNRLNAKWPLQIDATVQYALSSSRCRIRICDWWPKNLTKADLAIISPFNTYKNPGLPPASIGNPGKSSLSAAANPLTTKNWFYLHDASGLVHFAPTVEIHNQNVCTFLKKDCSK